MSLVGAGERGGDVIVAPATAPGVAALAIVRLTGPADALDAVARALLPGLRDAPERTAHVATALDADGAPIDELVAIRWKGPRSPTGEDVLELVCHGSPAIVEALVAAARAAGARPAARGEFTRRALANGKLDLAEAEGIARLASAETREEARRALSLVDGALSRRLADARETLLDILARLEAALDFAEDVEADAAGETARSLAAIRAELASLAATAERARAETLPRVVLAGPPNAGKSTLFNALVGADRVLVSARAGTTRDAVSERVALAGRAVTLVDTAGLRESDDEVESLGVDAARRAAAGADLVVWLVDGAVTGDPEPGPADALVVRTKADLDGAGGDGAEALRVSARSGAGLEALARAVAARLDASAPASGVLVLARHGDALARAGAALAAAEAACDAPELAAAELRRALHALGEITGETATEELLDRIFSTFCLGK